MSAVERRESLSLRSGGRTGGGLGLSELAPHPNPLPALTTSAGRGRLDSQILNDSVVFFAVSRVSLRMPAASSLT